MRSIGLLLFKFALLICSGDQREETLHVSSLTGLEIRPGDSEGTLHVSSQAATCPPLKVGRSHQVPFPAT